jgi:hypothetical protein
VINYTNIRNTKSRVATWLIYAVHVLIRMPVLIYMYLFLLFNDIGEMSVRNSWVEFTLKKMNTQKLKNALLQTGVSLAQSRAALHHSTCIYSL